MRWMTSNETRQGLPFYVSAFAGLVLAEACPDTGLP